MNRTGSRRRGTRTGPRTAFTLTKLLVAKPAVARRAKARATRTTFTLIELPACQPKPRGRRQAKAAFTLIELLVVVAILAILMAMLLPVLGRAKRRVNLTECTSRQRQLSQLYSLYESDNDTWFPWTHGGRYWRGGMGVPQGFKLGDYGPFEIPGTPDFLGRDNASLWNCVGDKWFGVGVSILVGFQPQSGQVRFMPAGGLSGAGPDMPTPYGNRAPPYLSNPHITIRRSTDIGSQRICQTFFCCFSYSDNRFVFSRFPQYGSHDWQYGNPVSCGVSTWSDGHATTWYAPKDIQIMFEMGSDDAELWNNEAM